jgi:hypothetical protein
MYLNFKRTQQQFKNSPNFLKFKIQPVFKLNDWSIIIFNFIPF